MNASPASADQEREDKEVKSLTTSMQRLLFGQEDSRDEDSEEEHPGMEDLTIDVESMVLGEEKTGGYEVSSERASQGSEDFEEECYDELASTHQPHSSLQTSLPQPDLSNRGQENLDPSMNSTLYVGSLVLSRASDPRFSAAQGSVEYMSAGTTAEGDDLWLRTPPRSARSYATSSGTRPDVSERSPRTSAPLFRSSALVMETSQRRLDRISSRNPIWNLLNQADPKPLLE